jgi:hypothetical protein
MPSHTYALILSSALCLSSSLLATNSPSDDQADSLSAYPSFSNPEAEKWYDEAIQSGTSDKAFEKGKLVEPKNLSPHAICLLINAYEEGHKQSEEILNQILALQDH